ncbi:hypothetical protein BDR26DRAFT_897736 [Obelidium mucronatum]|nr:hypothetical protein BDR26DRAFT_897736 [Obelidium mucronatum]
MARQQQLLQQQLQQQQSRQLLQHRQQQQEQQYPSERLPFQPLQPFQQPFQASPSQPQHQQIAANRTAIIATVATTVATSPADAAAAAASTAATAATVRKRSWWTKHWCSLNQSFARNWCDARYTSPDSCAAALTPQPLPALEDGWLNQGVIFSTHLMGTSPVFDTFSLSTVIENMSPEWKPRFKRIALGTDLHTTVFKVCSKSYSDSKDNIAKKLFGKYGKGARMTAKQNLPLKRFAEHLFSNSSLAKLNRSALLLKIR